MADLESFLGGQEGSESMDPAAFERFKERMAAAAAQLKALQAGEQKQKKKEDELVKILLKYIQSGDRADILLLITRLLEQNVPAPFLVSVLLINTNFIQQELGIKLLASQDEKANTSRPTLPDRYMQNQTLPFEVKLTIDAWIREMSKYAHEKAKRLIETALDEEGTIKLPLKQLAVLCLQDYLRENNINLDYDDLKSFMEIMLEGILKKVQEDLKKNPKLDSGEMEGTTSKN